MIFKKWQILFGTILSLFFLVGEVFYFIDDFDWMVISREKITADLNSSLPIKENQPSLLVTLVKVSKMEFVDREKVGLKFDLLVKVEFGYSDSFEDTVSVFCSLHYDKNKNSFKFSPYLLTSGSKLSRVKDFSRVAQVTFSLLDGVLDGFFIFPASSNYWFVFKKARACGEDICLLVSRHWNGGVFQLAFMVFPIWLIYLLNIVWIKTYLLEKIRKVVKNRHDY